MKRGANLALMDIHRASLDTCAVATGAVIVIDVLRAFTTAAYAFDAGVESITVVSAVGEAFALRDKHPDWLIVGERGGIPIDGFDFGNSPLAFLGRDLTGRHLVQRTSSGTQGVVSCKHADHIVASSLCCARATVAYVTRLRPERVTMVITGAHSEGLGDEDRACADYLEALMCGDRVDLERVIERVRTSRAAQTLKDPEHPRFSPADVECAVDVDRFPFAMVVRRKGDHLVMRPVQEV
jgi:2-phosphosulfolactate phosphatase